MSWEVLASLVVPALVFLILLAKQPKDDLRALDPVSRHWLAEHIKDEWPK